MAKYLLEEITKATQPRWQSITTKNLHDDNSKASIQARLQRQTSAEALRTNMISTTKLSEQGHNGKVSASATNPAYQGEYVEWEHKYDRQARHSAKV